MTELAIGIDIGGTNLRAALVGAAGAVVRVSKQRIADASPEALLAATVAAVGELGPDATRAPMAAGLAALLLVETGYVLSAPNLGWRDVPFGAMLARAFGRPVRLVNDLDMIAFGEARCGAGRGASDVMCVFVGTGVGLGVVSHGRVVEGADGIATEIGHVKTASPVTGRLCGCGERGCLEAYASGRHFPARLGELVAAGYDSPLWQETGGDPARLTADRIEAAVGGGDHAATALWDDAGERLGLTVGNCVTLWNPRVLVLGGGVLVRAPSLRQRMINVLEQVAWHGHRARLQIRDTELGDDAGIIGAGLLALTT